MLLYLFRNLNHRLGVAAVHLNTPVKHQLFKCMIEPVDLQVEFKFSK